MLQVTVTVVQYCSCKFWKHTVISRNFARAIIVFIHHFSPALQRIRRQYESFQKFKQTWQLFFSLRVQWGVKTDPALFRTDITRNYGIQNSLKIYYPSSHGRKEGQHRETIWIVWTALRIRLAKQISFQLSSTTWNIDTGKWQMQVCWTLLPSVAENLK